MKTEVIPIQQKDGYRTRLFFYSASSDAVQGSILILHGMAEHHGRYLEFIQRLTLEGFDVYAYDHRGHGTDKALTELGYFAPKGGAALVISDAIQICNYIKENGRSKKLGLFGHSMGAIIVQCLMQQYPDFTCVVVSSTTAPPAVLSGFGVLLGNVLCLLQGAKKQSPFLHKLMFGGKLYSELCTRTTFDWLTRNNTIVGKYIDDPYCGFVCTTSFYRDLISLTKKSTTKRCIKKIRKNLPIAFLTGTKDPVGGYAKGVINLHKLYEKLGFTNLSLSIYEDARHELLNEFCVEEVTTELVTFFHNHFN